MAFDQGGPGFGLNDLKVAAYNATNSYGSAVDVYSAQALRVTMRVISAELTGDDTITSTASRPVGGQATMRFGGVSLAALEVMTGKTATSSIASPNNVKALKIAGGEDLPFFGICGKALGADSAGQTEVFIPKAKIMSDINLIQMEYGTFIIPEVTVAFVADATFGILQIIEAEAERAIAIPPANIPTS